MSSRRFIATPDIHGDSNEPPRISEHSTGYRTRAGITFTFRTACQGALRALKRSAVRSRFASGILRRACVERHKRLGGRVEPTVDVALEFAEAPAAPGLLPEFAPLSGTLAPQPMTQRRVLSLATPIIGENLLQTLVGAVDTFMVARLGPAAVAGDQPRQPDRLHAHRPCRCHA